MNNKKCSICGIEKNKVDNNAYPISDGLCCRECNDIYVIAARLKEFFK